MKELLETIVAELVEDKDAISVTRITSYNVCYTKLLRSNLILASAVGFFPPEHANIVTANTIKKVFKIDF